MTILSSSGLSNVPTTQTTVTPSADLQPYAKNVLEKGNALINAGTPAYTGQLTAGPSNLQEQAWSGLAGLTLPSDMTTAGTTLGDLSQKAAGVKFDPSQIQQYMNPYLSGVLNPQLEELRRQSQINLQPSLAKLTQAGGFGGGRQAIMESEAARNLLTEQNKTVGQGYANAYDSAMKAAQYASDLGLKGLQTATQAAQAQGNVGAQEAQYGLQNLQALSTAGKTQQEQEQAALNAQYNEWLRQLNYMPSVLKAQQGLIQGMPGGTTTSQYTAKPSGLQSVVGASANVAALMKNMKDAGMTSDMISSALKAMGVNPATLQGETTAIENTAQPGQEGYGWQYFSDGTSIDPSGNYYRDGQMIWSPSPTETNLTNDQAGGEAATGVDSEGNPII